ncbi:hypothetical protein PPERSA_06237 [Pseudocohnilembus persalinus]|uniref:Uncharacterized protein n=1 Tax=Pseudocohnilembus persalinus TaxID=266149 RepID=A0A0V0QW31_PSEPJ|nr:hypothetical protein PPERSA_06237 [Pseudocohnilembus persalinus]|eukprot:KRX06266.1 hypothetical protein PPERSA_06237 [Pseudocohnilembus persalinus]
MAKQYKKRIENFIVDSLDNPIKITDYKEKINVFRQEKPEKFLGDAQIYVTGFKNEQERIRLNQQKLNNLSIEPKINISNYNFRERQTDKEIQPEMRFQSYKTSLNKLQDYIKNNNMNEVENMNYQEEKQHKKLESSIVDQNQSFKSNNLTKRQQNYAYYAQSIAKTLMPTLHQKTHFKALQDICNQSPGSLSDKPKKKQYMSQDMKNQDNLNDNKNENNNNTGVQDILSSLQDRKQSVGQGVQALLGTELKKQSSQIISAQGSDQLSNFGGRDSIIEQQKLNKKNSKINAGLETFDGPSFSKKILQRSHFIRPQNDKIPILLKGHGKSMFSKGLSNSQVYDQWSSKGQ